VRAFPAQATAKVVALLGGRLESYYVTSTGSASVVMTYTVPKNHDVQTLLFTLMGCGSYKART
jgi:hypothetical protein